MLQVARWSDIAKLRMDMQMVQAKVKNMYNRGYEFKDISEKLDISEKSTRVIIAWMNKR